MPAARNAKGQFISSTAQSSQPSTDPPVMSGASPSSSTSPPNQPSTSPPIQPSTSSPSPATSLNATDIATIVQAVLLANQQQQVQAQPQQSQIAHFTGPPSINPTAGKLSVQDLFPEVEGSVLASVLGHTLTASDLYKLDARYRDKPDRSTLELDGTSLRIRGDATARDYPSFSYIHQPLVNYFTVLIHHVPDCKYFAAAAMLYVRQLQKLNDEYEWSAVLRYHLAFFQRRHREMQRGDYTRWGLRDSDLFDEHLVGHRRQRPTEQKKPPRTGTSSEVCRLFNAGNCTSPCRNGRVHKCQTCNSEAHGASTHPAPTKTT